MSSTDLCYRSAAELSRLIQKKEISPVEVIESHLSRIESVEPTLNSFITLLPEQAMTEARLAEKEIQTGHSCGPLHGIPYALKDLYYVKGVRNTSGSKIFDRFIPDFDSAVAARLKGAGAILLGKLNLHPFAYGPTGENSDYGPAHNPWAPALITGGSSGGSGSATASGQCPLTMGTDTGGSIRIPSALCGLVGLKPTYGRISRRGIFPLSWSLDHSGPMTRTVEDCVLAMNVLAGHDPGDPSSAKIPVPDYTKALTGDVKGLRVAAPKEFFELPIDPQVERAVRKATDLLGTMGAEVDEISLPGYPQWLAASTIIIMAEATAFHSHLIRSSASRYDPMVRLRLEAGFFISSSDYIQAMRARTLFYRQSCELLKRFDLLAGPTVPTPAFRIGTAEAEVGGKKMKVIPLLTQYTRAFNLIGFPAITLPCGFSEKDLPIGLQLVGRPFEEETVLRAAYAYEQATEWHQRRPPI
jgi:aspartyl-tRNA(Asn)/glutamyl-tRNA(Gln) amidotransferase subunit A